MVKTKVARIDINKQNTQTKNLKSLVNLFEAIICTKKNLPSLGRRVVNHGEIFATVLNVK